jgi:exonuclease SbcD
MVKPDQSASQDPARLLAIGDIHLGTRCSGLPGSLAAAEHLTPAAALEGAVVLAIELGVYAVLFAGDVVESMNARFEAMVPLEKCVARLSGAGIQVAAVAGNHDVDALPRLAGRIEGFTLLGAGGRWESLEILRDGQALCEIIGWSFGQEAVRESPVAQLLRNPVARTTPIPRLGLLHADLNASGGKYAPIKGTELEQTDFDAWLLGHIHKPSLAVSPDMPCGYLGSLVGLDATETGPHGPWMITVHGRGRISAEQHPIAPLRWEHISVSVGGTDHIEDVAEHILDAMEATARGLADLDQAPRALGLRIRIEGETPHSGEIRAAVAGGEWNRLERLSGVTTVFVNKVIDALGVPVNLTRIAAGKDPPALMARRILALKQGGAEAAQMVARARDGLRDFEANSAWSPLKDRRDPTVPLSDDQLSDVLVRAGMTALNAMLEQRAGSRQP